MEKDEIRIKARARAFEYWLAACLVAGAFLAGLREALRYL